ncbi:hypothetical protein RHSIM_Rhsim09G0121800 [Rhododendron simsii]|uniref:Prolyl endopeptidase n=1 Tax=Rhododendron simsii TaxID=118357 RepID=A0A834LDY4_RHOSS|nr:hypothetical protein RHSIM_Rhsim09G0121800 [Rhododendron simsii]
MASALLLKARSLRNYSLPITSRLFPPLSFSSSSSVSSSACKTKTHPLSQPSQTKTPPSPKKVPFTVSVHGRKWVDPYHWMRNTNDPDFFRYLSQENSYAEDFMADTQKLRQALVSEMRSRMPAEVSTPPERLGPWLYYQFVPEGKEYPVLCRRLATEKKDWMETVVNYLRGRSGKEEILLDWNEIAEQYGYVHVGTCRVSPNHNFLAYTLDTTGGENFMLQIKDLTTLHNIPKSRVDGVVSLAWAQDGCTLFYTESDENQRPYRQILTVYVIDASNPQDGLRRLCKRVPGVQFFVEHHCGFFYVLTNASLGEDKDLSTGTYYLGRVRVEDMHLNNWQRCGMAGTYEFLSEEGGVRLSDAGRDKSSWLFSVSWEVLGLGYSSVNIIVPSKGSSLRDMDILNGHLVLFLDKMDSTQICSINLPIDVDCKFAFRYGLGDRFLISRIVDFLVKNNKLKKMPDVIVDYDMSRRTFSIVHQEDVLGVSAAIESSSQTFDREVDELPEASEDKEKDIQNCEVCPWKDFSDSYLCETKEVLSHDGVVVPLTILYSKKSHLKDQSPGILLGYGAYGEALDKSWCSDRLSLLDRGWVVAFADVRGGGGVDPSWHKSGGGLHKLNSIYDFVSCGKFLVNEGYVCKDKLGAVGHSAGCLLVAAAINMYPDLFQAAIMKVPFLDICNTLLDPSLPLTILDYEEFGNPQIQSQLESILQYSPYDNIAGGVCCPSVLVTASFHDSRQIYISSLSSSIDIFTPVVGVWEAAKWVAKVRDMTCSSCSRSVILKTNMSGGHFGEGGRFGLCEETSYEYAFLMKVMGFLDHKVL